MKQIGVSTIKVLVVAISLARSVHALDPSGSFQLPYNECPDSPSPCLVKSASFLDLTLGLTDSYPGFAIFGSEAVFAANTLNVLRYGVVSNADLDIANLNLGGSGSVEYQAEFKQISPSSRIKTVGLYNNSILEFLDGYAGNGDFSLYGNGGGVQAAKLKFNGTAEVNSLRFSGESAEWSNNEAIFQSGGVVNEIESEYQGRIVSGSGELLVKSMSGSNSVYVGFGDVSILNVRGSLLGEAGFYGRLNISSDEPLELRYYLWPEAEISGRDLTIYGTSYIAGSMNSRIIFDGDLRLRGEALVIMAEGTTLKANTLAIGDVFIPSVEEVPRFINNGNNEIGVGQILLGGGYIVNQSGSLLIPRVLVGGGSFVPGIFVPTVTGEKDTLTVIRELDLSGNRLSVVANNSKVDVYDLYGSGELSLNAGNGGVVFIRNGISMAGGSGFVSFSSSANSISEAGLFYIGTEGEEWGRAQSSYVVTVGNIGGVQEVALSSRVSIDADSVGNVIQVRSGFASLKEGSKVRLSSKGRVAELSRDTIYGVFNESGRSRLSLEGLEVDFNNSAELTTGVGRFIPVFTAKEVGVGERSVVELLVRRPTGEYSLGNVLFKSRSYDGVSYVPELVRLGCSVFFVDDCSVNVLGARSVRTLGAPVNDSYSLPWVDDSRDAGRLIGDVRIQSLADDSKSVYEGVVASNALGYISSAQVGDFVSIAKVNEYSEGVGEITIAIRGTYSFQGLVSDAAFFSAENALFSEHIFNAASFISSVKRANPDSTIRLTGHSLGGGVANFLGYVSGLESVGYNSPDISGLIDYYNDGGFRFEVAPIRNMVPRNGDYSYIQNVRIAGDLVSGARLGYPNPEFGQEITVSSLNSDLALFMSYVASGEDSLVSELVPSGFLRVYRAVGRAYDFHRIGNLIFDISDYGDGDVVEIRHNGVVVFERPSRSLREVFESALDQFVFPDSGDAWGKALSVLIQKNLVYFLDPVVGSEFDFGFSPESIRFNRLILPDVEGGSDFYDVMIDHGEGWVAFGGFYGGDIVHFPDYYDRIKIVSVLDLGDFFASDELFFGVTFSQDGMYEGFISSVPEISRAYLFGLGLLVLCVVCRVSRLAQ